MTAFVHGAEDHRIEEIRVHSRRDAHIAPAAAVGEWMGSLILAAAFPIVAKLGDDFHAEIPLLLLVESLVQERIVHLRFRGDGFDQFHLPRAQGVENRLDIRRLHAWLEDIQ